MCRRSDKPETAGCAATDHPKCYGRRVAVSAAESVTGSLEQVVGTFSVPCHVSSAVHWIG